MIIAVLIFLFTVIIILLFASPRLSPVPYYPSNKHDLPLILDQLELDDGQTVIDMGAGSGTVLFEAAGQAYAHYLTTRFIGIEINPLLVIILHLRRLFHPNRRYIQIIWGDMFTYDFAKLLPPDDLPVTFYFYISPWLLEKAVKHIRNLDRPLTLISYMYNIPSLAEYESRERGIHFVYRYKLK